MKVKSKRIITPAIAAAVIVTLKLAAGCGSEGGGDGDEVPSYTCLDMCDKLVNQCGLETSVESCAYECRQKPYSQEQIDCVMEKPCSQVICCLNECGDGLCLEVCDETDQSCPEDCFCGDGLCESWEDAATCPDDCY